MARYRQVAVENPGDWSEWIHPLPGYRLACCDCGLVHDVEFKNDEADGAILFRIRRNRRATAAIRREDRKRMAREQE